MHEESSKTYAAKLGRQAYRWDFLLIQEDEVMAFFILYMAPKKGKLRSTWGGGGRMESPARAACSEESNFDTVWASQPLCRDEQARRLKPFRIVAFGGIAEAMP